MTVRVRLSGPPEQVAAFNKLLATVAAARGARYTVHPAEEPPAPVRHLRVVRREYQPELPSLAAGGEQR